jgi:hypothetical protein
MNSGSLVGSFEIGLISEAKFSTSEHSLVLLQNKWAIDSISSQQEITLFEANGGRNGCSG